MFWDLCKIKKKFWGTEKFTVNLGDISEKCKSQGNLRIIKDSKIFGNFWERILKNYEKVLEEMW